jgi:hypothetical protein
MTPATLFLTIQFSGKALELGALKINVQDFADEWIRKQTERFAIIEPINSFCQVGFFQNFHHAFGKGFEHASRHFDRNLFGGLLDAFGALGS